MFLDQPIHNSLDPSEAKEGSEKQKLAETPSLVYSFYELWYRDVDVVAVSRLCYQTRGSHLIPSRSIHVL